MNTLQDRIRGSLIGGAIGDALGYPVEFIDSFEGIQSQYGDQGITRLEVRWTEVELTSVGKAVISDDTQMALFTANGMLNAKRQKIDMKYGICLAYIEWYLTQIGKKSGKYKDSWIGSLPELNKRRAPGNTCMTSLNDIYRGKDPINNSKGCGGVMRVAPIPLYAVVDNRMSITDAARLAGDAAEITHQHPLGFIPAALVAHIIYRLALDGSPNRESFENYIHEGMAAMEKLYPQYPSDVNYMGELCDKAIMLASNTRPDLENIESIGGGWAGEEARVQDDNDRFGFIDQKGTIVIPCKWKNAGSFSEGLARVLGDNDLWGYINEKDTLVIPCQWGWGYGDSSFNDDLACIRDEDDNYGFIDKSGAVVVLCKWKRAESFHDGLACVSDDNDKQGFIDRAGTVVVPCKWNQARPFSEGLACVCDDNGKWGVIDKTGAMAIPCIWEKAGFFRNGVSMVYDDQWRCCFIDKTGKVIASCGEFECELEWEKVYS